MPKEINDFYSSYISLIDPSFGAVSKKLLQFIKSFGQKEGILLDPAYNAKLFYSAMQLIEENKMSGNCLIIHSGGGLGLVGYLNKLRELS